MQVYLDNAATTKPLPEVMEAMQRALGNCFGNPSAIHRMGFEAEKMMKSARASVARALGVKDEAVFFTSGGTEADNWAIIESVRRHIKRGAHVITTSVEHPAVLEPMKRLEEEGADVSYLSVDDTGCIDVHELESAIRDDTVLISIMQANNEVGTIMPMEEVSRIARQKNVALHSDCVQSFGKIEALADAQLKSISAHKIHGPKGVGALVVEEGFNLPPLILGGGQEGGQRSGTENLPGIVGFGAACEAINNADLDLRNLKMRTLRNYLADELTNNLHDCIINTNLDEGRALPNILNVSFLGTKSEVIIHMLEERGVYVSAGSACSAKSSDWSHVLRAMNLDRGRIEGAVRFSLSSFTTEEEIAYACEQTVEVVKKFRKLIGTRNR